MDDVPEKAGRVLNMVLLAFLLIAIRVWYLAVVKHEEHAELAKRPQHRVSIVNANRGTIRDRFNIPLAVNQIQYNAAICFEPISHLPRVKWIKDETGKRLKTFYRKEYIQKLSTHLAEQLNLDAMYIEDLIWSKAAIFPNTPFVLKENVCEQEYYRLHMMERDWPGLTMEIGSRRHYPRGKLACNVLGYMGAISSREHLAIRDELRELEAYLHDRAIGLPIILPKGYMSSQEVRRRYQELKDRSYTINSRVGKSGIEGRFDDQLRGISGRIKREVDNKGTTLRTLPESHPAIPGRRFLLTISAELQEFAEELLMQSELTRINRFSKAGKGHGLVSPPWIKGGAIVAMKPSTGEVIAMASYPRFAPEDFSHPEGRKNVPKWLESESYIGSIWNGIHPLERDFWDDIRPNLPVEQLTLSWDVYLDMILSRQSHVRRAMTKIANLHNAIYLQNSIETLYSLSEVKCLHHLMDTIFPEENGNRSTFHDTSKEQRAEILATLHKKTSLVDEIVNEIRPFLSDIERNDDKILAIDLCRIVCPNHLFDDRLLTQTGEESLSAYRAFNQTVTTLEKHIRTLVWDVFHKNNFQQWRETFFKSYLAEKRADERARNTYQRPYLDYLEAIEEKLFSTFFEQHKWEFLACHLLDNAPLSDRAEMTPYYRALIAEGIEIKSEEEEHLKNHLEQMDSPLIISYLKTMRSFKELNRPLYGRYYFTFGSGKDAPEKSLARAFYPSPGYGYGRSFAFQETGPLGSVFKLATAYEALRQHYDRNANTPGFTINPLTIIDQSPPYSEKMTRNSILGYTLSGVPLLRHYKGGRVPRGHLNIGRVDMKDAIVRSSNLYFALLTSDVLNKPSDLSTCARELGFGSRTGIDLPNEMCGIVPADLDRNQSGLYSFSIGQHSLTVTPLQTGVFLSALANGGSILKPQIVHTIANLEPANEIEMLFDKESFAYKEILKNIGIRFPLFTEVQETKKLPYVWKCDVEQRWSIPMPDPIRKCLLGAMYDVINSDRGTGRAGTIRTLWESGAMRRNYHNMRGYLAGKTSTAEIAYRPCIDREFSPILCKHIGYSGMSFKEKGELDESDLVVVVQLRFGDLGKETVPLAAEIVNKWREICNREE